MDEKSIFNKARKISDPEIRDEYVQMACGDNTEALNRIQELLAANADDSSFLEAPPVDVGETKSLKDEKSRIGERIGPYKLLQEIGEGGMGSVYMAEQTEPVKRRVALKIIKAGMDSKQVIARFEAERQALAMMDHPNIARLLDVGTTDSGRPYIVMELVKGTPITEYCDDKKLSVKQRLELFTSLCNAVQHAHQKGIIHRDLKPSNILVAEYDDKVVPKIIDFGLAKALHQCLTDKTVFTQFGQVVGTFAYMSPEQSKMNQLDVDTRTDVYSLGVLLYELLIGTTPFDGKRFKDAAIDQILRMIREEDPPKPSTRLSSSDSKPEVADKRNIDPRKLSILMRGDLDWIVMRAMEKDRSDRYETVNGLGMDVSRFLAGEATVAAPPSARYRLRKFLKRNRAGVIAGSLIAASLLIGLVGTSSGLFWAINEKSRAENAEQEALNRAEEAKQVSDYQAKIFEKLDAESTGEMFMHNIRGSFATTLDALGVSDVEYRKRMDEFSQDLALVDSTRVVSWVLYQRVLKPAFDEIEPRFKDQPVVANKLRQEFAKIYYQIGNHEEALEVQEQCIKFYENEFGYDDPRTISAQAFHGDIYLAKGDLAMAEKIIVKAVDDSKRLRSTDKDALETLAEALRHLARLREKQGRYSESLSSYREALRIYQDDLGDEGGTFVTQIDVLKSLPQMEKHEEAIKLGRKLLPLCEKHHLDDEHEITLMIKFGIAKALLDSPNWKAAEPLLVNVLEKRRKKQYGNFLSNTLSTELTYIRFLYKADRISEAIELAEQNLDRIRLVLGSKSKKMMVATNQLGLLYKDTRDFEKADRCFRDAIELCSQNVGESARDTISSKANLAVCQREMKRYRESKKLLLECIKVWGEEHGKRTPEYFNLHRDLVATLVEMNDKAGALQILGKLFEGLNDGDLLVHPKVRATITAYVKLLQDLGRHNEAVLLRRKVWQAMERQPGKTHPDTLQQLYLLAYALELDDNLEKADEYCRIALKNGRDLWGPESHRSMVCQRVLARVEGKLGRIEEAKEKFRLNIELRQRIQGETHWETIGTIKDYVSLLLNNAELDTAETYRNEVIWAMRNAEGDIDGNSWWELNRLGQKFEFKGNPKAAEECYRLAFDQGSRKWGEESHRDMVCQRMLARMEGRLKRSSAETRFKKSIEVQLRVRGDKHVETIATIKDFDHLYYSQENYAEAENWFREAMKLARKAKGEDDNLTLNAKCNVADALEEQEKYTESEAYFRDALKISRRAKGDHDSYTLAVQSSLGRVLVLQNKLSEAEGLLQECLAGIKKLENIPTWIDAYLWQAQTELGHVFQERTMFAEAEPLLISGYTGCKRWIPTVSSLARKKKRVQECLERLVNLYESWHVAEPEKGYDSKALEWKQKLDELDDAENKNEKK